LQFDYVQAYLDFCEDSGAGVPNAKRIAEQYKDYPVVKKRKLFLDILSQASMNRKLFLSRHLRVPCCLVPC